MTPAQVEFRLRQLGREMDDAHIALVNAESEYARAKSMYEVESARARMAIKQQSLEIGAKITVQEIEDRAMIRTEEHFTALNASEAVVRSARANVARIRTHIDIARSVGTSVRASMEVV